jgi:integrase
MLALGLRESEALGLQWEFLDLDRGTMVVGRIKDARFVTKGGEARQLPIPAWLLERLKARWERNKKPKEGLVMPGPLDPISRKPLPHSAGYTRPLVKRVGASLGLVGLSPHRLRASFISALALEAKVPLPQVQKMAGHKHLATTMRYVEGAEEHTDALASLEKLQGFTEAPLPKQKRGVSKKSSSEPNSNHK